MRISTLHALHQEASPGELDGGGAVYLVVDPGPALASRIEERVDKMLDAGWVEEVRGLMDKISADAPAWKASGYSLIRDHVESQLDLSSARQRIIIETRQYAKRQRTWFRHQLPEAAVTLVNPQDSRARAVVREWWERAE
jgi:tRNA dimethylallyltransferase